MLFRSPTPEALRPRSSPTPPTVPAWSAGVQEHTISHFRGANESPTFVSRPRQRQQLQAGSPHQFQYPREMGQENGSGEPREYVRLGRLVEGTSKQGKSPAGPSTSRKRQPRASQKASASARFAGQFRQLITGEPPHHDENKVGVGVRVRGLHLRTTMLGSAASATT